MDRQGEDIAQMPMWKSYLYHLQQQAPKPKRIVCQRELSKVSSRPTYYGREYHGDISREDADFLLTIGGEGSYLIRESQRARGQYTLAIRFDGVTKNFKLYYDGQHYVGEKRFDTVQDLVADGLIIFYLEAKAHDYISSLSSQSNYAESPYVAYNTQRKKHLQGSMPRSARRAQREQQIAAQKALEEAQKSPAPVRNQNSTQQPDGIVLQQPKPAPRDSVAGRSAAGEQPKPAERTNIPYNRQDSDRSRKVAVNIPVEGSRLSQILETRQDAKQIINKSSKTENDLSGAAGAAPSSKTPQSPAPELKPRKTRHSRQPDDVPPSELAPQPQPSTSAGASGVGHEVAGPSVTDGEKVKVSHSTNTDGPSSLTRGSPRASPHSTSSRRRTPPEPPRVPSPANSIERRTPAVLPQDNTPSTQPRSASTTSPSGTHRDSPTSSTRRSSGARRDSPSSSINRSSPLGTHRDSPTTTSTRSPSGTHRSSSSLHRDSPSSTSRRSPSGAPQQSPTSSVRRSSPPTASDIKKLHTFKMLDDFSTPPSSPPPPGGGAGGAGQHVPLDYDPTNFKLSSVSWCTDYLEVMGSEKPHNFKLHTFKGPHWCDYCANFLWGLIAQGVKCQDCGFNAHKKCSQAVPNDCMPDMKYVKRMFGVDLTTLVKAQNTLIPAVCEACIKEIEKRGLDSEGLYRVAGFHDDVESIKMLFDKVAIGMDRNSKTSSKTSSMIVDHDEFPDISPDKYEDINTITSVLKLYLRLLPIPLVTFDIYYTVIEIIKREDITDDKRADLLRQTYNQLPPAHYHTFKYLMAHLSRVTDHRQQNMMNPDNLAIVFAPTLLRSPETDPLSGLTAVKYERELIEFTIIHHATIFE